ncbi:MAG: hypothetical protein ACOX5R_05410 [bacterium]|jgi:hypothetical protein
MEDFEYLAFLLPKGSLVKPPQYIFEQVLYYYQKEELRVTPLYFAMPLQEIYGYIASPKPLQNRGYQIEPGHRVYIFSDFEEYEKLGLKLVNIQIPFRYRVARLCLPE